MTARRPLALEALEDRLTPATSGITWPDGAHLTLSFVPDGTRVADYRSSLFATLNQVGSTAAWQQAILKAFQAWASQANLNVGVVPDGGQPLGTSGAVQGDARFGDIRIAAAPLAPGTLMTNTPFEWSGTTWSGDVLVNSSYLFSLGGGGRTYDLYTAMLNEAGNVFGVLDSHTDAASAVYYQYAGAKTGLDANDVADVHAQYGTRAPDQYDAAGGNGTAGTATNLGIPLTGVGLQADITTAADVDYYKFSIPVLTPGVLGLNIQLTTSGLSSLVGGLQVTNVLGQVVGSATATDPLHGDLTVTVSGGGLLGGLLGGLGYTVKVAAGNNAAFAVGSYNLTVSYSLTDGTIIGPIIAPLGTLIDGELGLNDTLNAAVQLPSRLLGGSKPDARFDYTARSSISGGSDVDYYKVRAPAGSGQKMNVLVWALEANKLLPRVDVYTADGAAVPATLLANENGTYSVEVPAAVGGATYYVGVSALAPAGGHNKGNYFLGVDFTGQPVTTLSPFTHGTLTAARPQVWWSLPVAQNRLYEFELSASAAASAAVEVRMDVYDAAGNDLFTLRSYNGVPASTGHVYLPAGTYVVRFTAVAPPGAPLPAADYALTGRLVSDPIGPRKDTGSDVKPGDGTVDTNDQSKRDGTVVWDQPYYA